MLQSMGSQRIGHDSVTELTDLNASNVTLGALDHDELLVFT